MTDHPDKAVWPAPVGTELSLWQFVRASWRAIRGRVPLFRDSQMLIVPCPVRSEARRLLPYGLILDRDRPAELMLANHQQPLFCEPYLEAGVLIPVKGLGGAGYYIPWMVVNHDTALIYGREILGVPKKMAALTWEHAGDSLLGLIERRDTTLLKLKGTLQDQTGTGFTPIFDRAVYSAGGPGQFVPFAPVWCVRGREEITASQVFSGELELHGSNWDPLTSLVEAPNGQVLGRLVTLTAAGGRFWFPAGIAAGRWFNNALALRCR